MGAGAEIPSSSSACRWSESRQVRARARRLGLVVAHAQSRPPLAPARTSTARRQVSADADEGAGRCSGSNFGHVAGTAGPGRGRRGTPPRGGVGPGGPRRGYEGHRARQGGSLGGLGRGRLENSRRSDVTIQNVYRMCTHGNLYYISVGYTDVVGQALCGYRQCYGSSTGSVQLWHRYWSQEAVRLFACSVGR